MTGANDEIGLVLPGGGARGAYQVGVLKAIADQAGDGPSPFRIVTGVSVGAINAAWLATEAQEFRRGIERLARMWAALHSRDVFRTDAWAVARSLLGWFALFPLGSLGGGQPRHLLDTRPLERLLRRELDFGRIEEAIAAKALRAVAVTATSYHGGRAVTFFQGESDLEEWRRARRAGRREALDKRHIMASAALPLFFSARRIDREHYGDGSLRLNAPLSPAIRLGARRILVIACRDDIPDPAPAASDTASYPSLEELAGSLLDMVFNDNLSADIERLERVNHTLWLNPEERRGEAGLRELGVMVIRPSRDLRQIARQNASAAPTSLRLLMRSLGAGRDGGQLASFLLFEPSFCKALIELGYRDGMQRADELRRFLDLPARTDI